MKKNIIVFLSLIFSAYSYSQSIKSINIQNNISPEGWVYGLNEIDSITIGGNGDCLILNIEGIEVRHHLSEIDSITFSEEEAPVFYAYVKMQDDTTHYILRNEGYVRISADKDGNIDELNALFNDVPIVITLDEDKKIRSIRTDSLDLYYDYQETKTIISGKFFSAAFCDTLVYSTIGDNRARTLKAKGNVSYTWHDIVRTAGEKIRDISVEKGLNKILGIAFSGQDSYDEAIRKSILRSSIKNLVGIAGTMAGIQELEDIDAADIIRESEQMPDLGGIENAICLLQYIDKDGIPARFLKWILSPIKKLQDHNKAILEQSEKEENRAAVICDIKTGSAKNVMSTSAICSIDGFIKVEANNDHYDLDYGICYSTQSQPTMQQNVKSTITSEENGSMHLTSSTFVINSLKPNTTYYYRAFLKDNFTGAITYAPNTETFTTTNSTPIPTTGDCTNTTTNSATVTCAYENVPEGGVCGVEYTWRNGSHMQSIGHANGTQTITLNGLEPGTTYTYCAYVEAYGQTYYGTDKTFTTKTEAPVIPDISGKWECQEYQDGKLIGKATFELKADGTVEISNISSSGGYVSIIGTSRWSINAKGDVNIEFERSTYSGASEKYYRGKIDNFVNPSRIEGRARYQYTGNLYGGNPPEYYDFIMTR